MRRKIINYGIIGLLIISIIALIYFDNAWELIKPGIVTLNSVSDTISEEEEQVITYGIEIPYNWTEIIDEKNCIDAVVDVPDIIRTKGFQKAVGVAKEVSREKALTIVETYYHPVYDGEDEYSVHYTGEDGMYFSFQKKVGSAYLMTDTYLYIRMAYRDGMAEDYNRDLYAVDSDLDSFSIEECDERLGNIFEKLGLCGDVNITHRALDYRIMEQEAVELHMDGTETKPDYDWSENDDSFLCVVSQTCNGISVIPTWQFTTPADILNVGAHTFVLNKDRVIGLDVDDIYDIEYMQEWEELLEFPDVLELFRRSPKLFTNVHYKEITDISLRVIAVADGENGYRMTPVWIFYGYWTDEDKTFEAPFAVIMNAITGEEL